MSTGEILFILGIGLGVGFLLGMYVGSIILDSWHEDKGGEE